MSETIELPFKTSIMCTDANTSECVMDGDIILSTVQPHVCGYVCGFVNNPVYEYVNQNMPTTFAYRFLAGFRAFAFIRSRNLSVLESKGKQTSMPLACQICADPI